MKILSVHFILPLLIAASLLFIPDAYAVGDYSRISGGQENTSDGNYSTVSGGKYNNSSGTASAIAGGFSNNASGAYSVVAGGERNIAASGDYSTIMGGTNNIAAGDYSWVQGKYMQLTAAADRTFVWGYSDTPISVTTADAFIIAPGFYGTGIWNPKVGIRDINPIGILEINANATADDYINIKRFAGDVFIVKNNGYIGIGRSVPFDNSYALQVGTNGTNGNGAYLSAGGVWTNGSSRKSKENISPLDSQTAQETLEKLNPMTFNYKASRQTTAGFIAEDVPEIVALKGRQALSAMDIIAVLTKVSQDQEQAIKAQKEKIERIKNEIKTLKKMLGN